MSKTAALCLSVFVAVAVSSSVLAKTSNGLAIAPSASSLSCFVPHGSGPGYNASIGNQQSGKSVCITVGERLLVVLSAGEANASPWRAIRSSKPGILQIAPLTLMFTRGTTGTNFKAIRVGSVELTAERPTCAPAPSGVATCDAIELWRAKVIVRAPAPALPRPSGTGIYGLVLASPTCPVERIGQLCPPRPVAGEVDVRDSGGKTAASTHTDSLGRYAVSLNPGRYTLVVVTGAAFPRCPNDVVAVPSKAPLRVDITCDTGIR